MAAGYDLWSSTYDNGDNLLLSLDDDVTTRLLSNVPLEGKVVIDVGCGTGRHWPRVLERRPASLTGYDASPGMLAVLRGKFPTAKAEVVTGCILEDARDCACDVLLSTLTLSHLPDLDAAFAEWSRVLRPRGDVVVTDLHPAVSAHGACTFEHDGRTHTIQTYARTEDELRAGAARAGLDMVRREERALDPSMRAHYASRGALALYETLGARPLVLGLHLRKASS